MKRLVFLFLFLVAAATMVSFAGDFNNGTTSKALTIKDNSGKTLRTYTLKDTDRTLDGTGLVGTVVDGGDHWIVNVYGGTLGGSISTQTGLEICLTGSEAGISTSQATTSIYGNGGVRICGPGMLHIDQNKNYNAIDGGKGGVTITLGAVVGINSLGSGTAIEGTGIRVLAAALHVNAVEGKGILCNADGDVEIGESIVTVGASDVALYHKGKGTIAISGSSVHLISGKQTALRCGYQEQVRGATSISIANSVFCALGAKHGIQGMLDGVGTAFSFDNVVGTIIGNDCGIYSSSTMLIDGSSTKLVIAGNLSGKHTPDELDAVSILGSDISTGQAICMPSLSSPPSSFFVLNAGSVKLFSPGSCALLAGTNAVMAGKLEIPSEARYSDFQTLFTWQGAISAAETFMGRSLFQSDSIYADFDIAQAFAGVVTPTVALFSLANAKTHTGVMADRFHVGGGEVLVESSNVGIHLGGYLYSKCGYLQQVGGRISVESDQIAIADDDAVDGYTSSQSENSGIYLSGGQLSARGGWDGILMDGYVFQKGGTLEAAATGGYSAGTISQKPKLVGYALSANYAFAIEGGSFIPTAGEVRFAPNTSSEHDYALVYPCNLTVSGTGPVTVSSMVPSWYGVNDLYPIGGKLRFWLPQGTASLSYKGTTYTANGTGTVVAGTNQFVSVEATLEKLSVTGDDTVKSGGRATYTCTASYSDGTSKTVDAEWTLVSGASFGSITAAGVFTAGTTTENRPVSIQAQWEELTATKTVTIVPAVQTMTFKGNGGTPETQTGSYTVGGAYGSFPSVAQPGYEFAGWWTSASGGTEVPASSTVTTDATRTLYAHWTPGTQTVTFKGNGGTPETQSGTYTIGETYGHFPAVSRTGHEFAGWWTAANGGTQVPATSTVTTDTTRTLFAHWVGEEETQGGLRITGFSLVASNKFTILGAGETGKTYRLEWTPELSLSWQTLGTSVMTQAGKMEWDIEAPVWGNQGFYRVTEGTATVEPKYIVVDIGGGKDVETWPVSKLTDVPEGGWTDEYKTTKLVLRRIEGGTFVMGSPTNELGHATDEAQHRVTLTKPYYIGVFEVTQRQWELAMETCPSFFSNRTYYATRPVEEVSYNDIRGGLAGAEWPAAKAVDTSSFLGILREKTGLAFDLPTEAQWEYACRAGTTTALNSGKNLTETNSCPNMDIVGRYYYNNSTGYLERWCDTSLGTDKVGSYLPNAWGLYDMHGNVGEWCLDWSGTYGTGDVIDPVGGDSGSDRVLRGGSWWNSAEGCRSANRNRGDPSVIYGNNGFRLCCPVGVP